jgi:hypothetical protein
MSSLKFTELINIVQIGFPGAATDFRMTEIGGGPPQLNGMQSKTGYIDTSIWSYRDPPELVTPAFGPPSPARGFAQGMLFGLKGRNMTARGEASDAG